MRPDSRKYQLTAAMRRTPAAVTIIFPVIIPSPQILARRRRSELDTPETELKAIAAEAIMGLRRRPKKGYKTPAATGIPITL